MGFGVRLRLIDNAVASGDKASLDRAIQTVRENQKVQHQASQPTLAKMKQRQNSDSAHRTPSVKQFVSPILITSLLLFFAYQNYTKYRRSISASKRFR